MEVKDVVGIALFLLVLARYRRDFGTQIRLPWSRFPLRRPLRIHAEIERGPCDLDHPEHGFTEPAIKVTVKNRGSNPARVADVRLGFAGQFGASVAPEAPPLRTHPVLPFDRSSGDFAAWYIPAERLSALLRGLHLPPVSTAIPVRPLVTVGDQVHKGRVLQIPTDPRNYPLL